MSITNSLGLESRIKKGEKALFSKKGNKSLGDQIFSGLTFTAALVILLLMAGIFLSLVKESLPAIEKFGFFSFLFSAEWDPVQEIYGALVPMAGTAMITVISMGLAVPLALGIAIFLTELCPQFLRSAFSAAIELLAAIPSIIYGMWGLFTFAPIMGEYIEPFLQTVFGEIPLIGILFEGTPLGIDILTAGILLSIMITPFIASISRDTLSLTPQVLKESAYGLGATRWEVLRDVVIPNSRYGILGGIIIAIGRALGETMAVAFVLGNRHEIASSFFDATATITVTLANEFTEADSEIYLSSLFLLALILFASSFIILATAKYIVHRGRKK